MTHITAEQKKAITALREKNVSFRQIAKQLAIPLGTCKTLYYSNRPPATAPVVKARNGQFKSAAPRTGPGRRPANGFEATSDKARTAACRERRKQRLVQLAGNLSAATDAELAAMLVLAIRTGDSSTVKAIANALYTRHCCNFVTVTKLPDNHPLAAYPKGYTITSSKTDSN